MTSYSIPSLGAILQLDRLPDIRFMVAEAPRFEVQPEVTIHPMVSVRHRVLTRAEILLPRRSVEFALNGLAGIRDFEAEREARIATWNDYQASRQTPVVEPAPPTARGRGQRRRRAAVEDVEEVAVEAEVADDAPPFWTETDDLTLLLINIDEVLAPDTQFIPLMQAQAVLDKMAEADRNTTVIQNNYEKLIGTARSHATAFDQLQQSDPSTLPRNEFSMPSATGMDDFDSDVRRVDVQATQTHQQRLRTHTDNLARSYNDVVQWFNTRIFSAAEPQFTAFADMEFTAGAITITQKDVFANFFTNEFVEVG